MRHLLFVGGDLNGQLLPCDDREFESPLGGFNYRLRPGNQQYGFPMMVAEGARDDWATVRNAVDAFFRKQGERTVNDD